uniref:Murine leukemia virus integrase C-terminal domain-containing protein n=1 Tax=Larimichthys crocea TaxID=215358 RepID=A0A0F8B421_LARCR
MDGEFDKETDDGGWGPSSSYKTVTEQLLEMRSVVRTMHCSKDTNDIMKQMREDVSKVLKQQGKTESDKGPLGKLLWGEAKQAGRDESRAEEEEKTSGWLEKGRKREVQRDAEKRKMKWNRWAVWWQAAQHTMTEQSKKTVTYDPTPVPPPYSPATPSAPTNPPPAPRGMYPTLNAQQGVSILQQVTSQQEGGQHTPPPEVEWVLLRVIKRKWSEPRWTGPFQVTERTSHAVRLRGKGDTWFHWSQCAAAEEPQRSLSEIQANLQEKSTESADSETDPTSTKGAE